MTRCLFAVTTTLVLLISSFATADYTLLPLLMTGEDERDDALGCFEPDFIAGVSTSELNHRAGGNAWGCSSEYATSIEFDITGLLPGLEIYSATLTIRKTGYADDSQGFSPLGVFGYRATGSTVLVPRTELLPETALGGAQPSSPNVDFSFDVTDYVHSLVEDGESRAGFLVAGLFNDAGYHTHIYVAGAAHSSAPRLAVEHEGIVPAETSSWSRVKAIFR